MISQKNKFIFVHIPKTAGNTVQSVLSKYSEDRLVHKGQDSSLDRFAVVSDHRTTKHSCLNDYLLALGPDLFWTMKRFTCVRNPWDRAVSFFFSPHRKCHSWDREQFVELLNSIQPICDFLALSTSNQDPLCKNLDFIIRYESLEKDFKDACGHLDIPYEPLPILNRSARMNYRHYYDADLIDIVRSRFSHDIELFKYEYDN